MFKYFLIFCRLKSSQNVALMQYLIPVVNQGFVFRVSMEGNDGRKSPYDPSREGLPKYFFEQDLLLSRMLINGTIVW